MRAETFSIDRIFTPTTSMVIPFYQRAYVWTEENWKKFIDDIIQIAISDDEDRERYFLGSIILKSMNDSQEYEVIDGQQRLTTIVMFMKALYLVMGHNDIFLRLYTKTRYDNNDPIEPILKTNHNDYATYMQIINLQVANPTEINESLLAKCFAFFVRELVRLRDNGVEIGEEHINVALRTLVDVFSHYVRLILIEVATDENEQQIFETINHEGVKLSTGEMLKNYLFTARDTRDLTEYQSGWKRVFEDIGHREYWEGKQTSGRITEGQIENFFYRFMLIKMLEPAIRLQLDAKTIKKYRKQEDLFAHFRSLREKLNLDKSAMRREIVEYAELYMNSFPSSTLQDVVESYPGLKRLAVLMQAKNMWTMTPYILYVLKNVQNVNEQIGIFGYMENYLLRRIICGSPTNSYSDLFSENLIGQGINTEQGFREYVNDTNNRGNLLIPSDTAVTAAMQQTTFSDKEALILLYMIESRCNTQFADDESHRNAYVDFCVEDIMPTKIIDGWPSAAGMADRREILTSTLGNYVLLREKLKTKESALAWPLKKDVMSQSTKSDGIKTSLLTQRNLPEWNENSIIHRNEYLAQLVINNWKI